MESKGGKESGGSRLRTDPPLIFPSRQLRVSQELARSLEVFRLRNCPLGELIQ